MDKVPAKLAVYMELPGAVKDADCSLIQLAAAFGDAQDEDEAEEPRVDERTGRPQPLARSAERVNGFETTAVRN